MFHGGCGNHPVRRVQGRSPQLALAFQYASPIGYAMRDGQDAPMKPYQQVSVKPRLKLGTAAAWGKHDESLADFTDSDGA